MGKKAMFCLLLDNLSDDEHRAICKTGIGPYEAQDAWGEMIGQVLGRPDAGESESTYSRFHLQHDETVAVMQLLEPDGPSEKASTPGHPLEELQSFRPRPDRSLDDAG